MTRTISEIKEISSQALMTGAPSTAVLKPSEEKGIRFHFNGKTVAATVEKRSFNRTLHCNRR